ncbi:4589_t:CDS:2 [Ambispora leptoticha]|uniref:4589_t:CDS:1 n=1 Tax=Ambispora leptoticha TaxID=144679 RepID=A0A9N8ZTM3_9GLOM|nr:4589_t:CDS:2 [Ambispora leptoticha]
MILAKLLFDPMICLAVEHEIENLRDRKHSTTCEDKFISEVDSTQNDNNVLEEYITEMEEIKSSKTNINENEQFEIDETSAENSDRNTCISEVWQYVNKDDSNRHYCLTCNFIFSPKKPVDQATFTRQQIKLNTIISNIPDKASITTDMWASIKMESFITIPIHFVDKDWYLRHFTLEVTKFQGSHTGTAICNYIMKTLEEFDLTQKIAAITTDNGSNIISACHQITQRLNPNNISAEFLTIIVYVIY